MLGILAVSIFNLDEYGVSIVGDIPTGLPTPGLPQVSLGDLPYLITGAVGIVFLAVGESLGAPALLPPSTATRSTRTRS